MSRTKLYPLWKAPARHLECQSFFGSGAILFVSVFVITVSEPRTVLMLGFGNVQTSFHARAVADLESR